MQMSRGAAGEGVRVGTAPPPRALSRALTLHPGQEGAGLVAPQGGREPGQGEAAVTRPVAVLNGPSKHPTSSSWLSGEAPAPCLQDPPTAAGRNARVRTLASLMRAGQFS